MRSRSSSHVAPDVSSPMETRAGYGARTATSLFGREFAGRRRSVMIQRSPDSRQSSMVRADRECGRARWSVSVSGVSGAAMTSGRVPSALVAVDVARLRRAGRGNRRRGVGWGAWVISARSAGIVSGGGVWMVRPGRRNRCCWRRWVHSRVSSPAASSAPPPAKIASYESESEWWRAWPPVWLLGRALGSVVASPGRSARASSAWRCGVCWLLVGCAVFRRQ